MSKPIYISKENANTIQKSNQASLASEIKINKLNRSFSKQADFSCYFYWSQNQSLSEENAMTTA